jgi:branched-chain amino acid aminotransferase
MPTLIRLLTPTGLQPVAYTADSLAEAAQHEPHEGVYTVANTFERTKTLKLDAHLDRMEDSAARAGMALRLDRARVRAALRQMIEQADFGDVRFRITAPQAQPDRLIVSIEPYQPPSEALVQTGVHVITVADSARHNPHAKTADWMHDRAQIERTLPQGVYTALLCDARGFILEGVSSNFYAIVQGELRTAREGVLPGIAQQIVFAVAKSILPCRREPVHLDALPRLDEAFLTSSSRGILPIVQIDRHRIGAGTPGAKTMALRAAYQAWVMAHLEPL